MALQDSFTTNNTVSAAFGGNTWRFQTFVAGSTYNLYSLRLRIYRSAGDPGTVTVHIRDSTGTPQTTTPTGADKASGSIVGSTLGTSAPGTATDPSTWPEIVLDTPLALTSGTRYAICISATNASTLYWRGDSAGTPPGGYSNGNRGQSTNAGDTWASASWDLTFATYTVAVVYHLTGTIAGISSCSGDVSVLTIISISGSFAGVSVFSGELSLAPLVSGWLITRPIAYDPLDVWSKDLQLWGTYPEILMKNGGRYNNSLIVVGIDADGLGVIYG
jgi:hypothetical protein